MVSTTRKLTLLNELDGMVWVMGGRVFVKNELDFGIPPVVNPCGKVKLYINGEECNEPTIVSDRDIIELEAVDIETDFKVDAEISQDKLKAYINYTPSPLKKGIIVDTYPSSKLNVEVFEVVLGHKKVVRENLLERIKKDFNIVFGIIDNTIDEICRNNKPGRYLISEGTAAVEPVDDWIEYFFDDGTNYKLNIMEYFSKKNDFGKDIFLKNFDQGEAIAQYHRGKPGVNSTTVTGETIAVRDPEKIEILPSCSINFNSSTGLITTSKSGSPSKLIRGKQVKFNLHDTLALDEVSAKSGNIKFNGSVEVNENVLESMEVIARQDILIKGNISFASVLAGNSITVNGTAVSSRINSALSELVAKNPSPLISRLTDYLDSLINNIKTCPVRDLATYKLKSIPDIIRHLLNTRNKDLPAKINKIIHKLREENYDIEDESLLKLAVKMRVLLNNCSEITCIDSLVNAVQYIKSMFLIKDEVTTKGDVYLNTITNSEVLASGDTFIMGKGCFNTSVYSKGNVVIIGDLRGGEVRADKSITVSRTGSEYGAKTLLVVPEDGRINIKQVYPDTIIKIGSTVHKFLTEEQSVDARLVKGRLEF